MAYKSERIRLQGLQDRRRKLQDFQKDEIKHKYLTGTYSLQKLANEYNVSKKTVLLIVNPDSKRKNDERMKEHWKDYRQTKEDRARTVREYRRYKQELYLKGVLQE